MTDSTFYNQVVKFIDHTQNEILQHMVDGTFIGQTLENTGMLYSAAHAKLKMAQTIKEGLQGIWAKHQGEDQQPKAPDLSDGAAKEGDKVESFY